MQIRLPPAVDDQLRSSAVTVIDSDALLSMCASGKEAADASRPSVPITATRMPTVLPAALNLWDWFHTTASRLGLRSVHSTGPPLVVSCLHAARLYVEAGAHDGECQPP